jgi:hypothetical protein
VSAVTAPIDPVQSTAIIDERWRERELPPELLAEARAAGMASATLERLLAWNAPAERIEEEVRWSKLLFEGRMRFRQLTVADGEALAELWANSPEDIGEWQVTVERGPKHFAQFELQERPVLNGLFDRETMVACVSFSVRPTLVGGNRIWIHFGQAMRVHLNHRRHGYAHWVRSLPWAIGLSRPTRLQYDYIRGRNLAMEAWNRSRMPQVQGIPQREGDVPGIPVTVSQFVAAPTSPSPRVRTATPADLQRCAALIDRTHAGRDLFRPYTADSLYDRLDPDASARAGVKWWVPPYALDDFHVLEDAGQIVACAGLWDRGRDQRERWRHRDTGAERVVAVTALLDTGHADGREDALAELIEHLVGVTHGLERQYLVAPLETLPRIAEALAHRDAEPETRYLVWRADTPTLSTPPYVDLVYW